MARRRMIVPDIWQNEDFGTLSILAKIIFIGLFSLADDEGRGRGNVQYLKSILFTYDENIKIDDIKQALEEIKLNMSIIFYLHENKQYYQLLHWHKWQKIDKPTPSTIPPPDITIDNTIENTTFNLEEIENYCKQRNSVVDAQYFFDYYTARNWILSNGQKIKDWRAQIRAWEKNSIGQSKTLYKEQHEYIKGKQNYSDKDLFPEIYS